MKDMKKEYIKPAMEVETVVLENMIAVSGLDIIDDTNAKNSDDDSRMMTKDRNDNWGGLLW